jgi:hypothetical protein
MSHIQRWPGWAAVFDEARAGAAAAFRVRARRFGGGVESMAALMTTTFPTGLNAR